MKFIARAIVGATAIHAMTTASLAGHLGTAAAALAAGFLFTTLLYDHPKKTS